MAAYCFAQPSQTGKRDEARSIFEAESNLTRREAVRRPKRLLE